MKSRYFGLEVHLYMLLNKELVININNLLTTRRTKFGIEFVNKIKDKARLVYYNGRILILKNQNFVYLFNKCDLDLKAIKKGIITEKKD